MALLKYLTQQEKPINSGSLFTKNEVEEAIKALAKVLEWKMVQRVLRSIFLKMEHQHNFKKLNI